MSPLERPINSPSCSRRFPKAARISEDRRAVVRVLCRLCGDRDGGGLVGNNDFRYEIEEHIASAKSLGDKTMLPKHRAFIAARSSNVSARGVAVMITELR